jgi:hypothetical protein
VSITLPSRWIDGLAATTLAVALLASAHNLHALARGRAEAMRCGAPERGIVCRMLCALGRT